MFRCLNSATLFCLVGLVLSVPAGAADRSSPDSDRPDWDRVFAELSGYEYGQEDAPLAILDAAVRSAHRDPDLREELESRFIELLEDGGTESALAYTCRKLSEIGSPAAVSALAAHLQTPKISHTARMALERIPGRRAARALRAALGGTEGRIKAGIIHSLGNRRDRGSVDALTPLLADPDPQIVAAAAFALGKIATPEAGRALHQAWVSGSEAAKPILENALLAAGERFAVEGRSGAARRVYRALSRDATSRASRRAAERGLWTVDSERREERLISALGASDSILQGMAARFIAETSEDADAYVGVLMELGSEGQMMLLDALAERRETSARPAIRTLANTGSSRVRIAAVEALGRVGAASDALLLARLASTKAEAAEEVRAAARTSLASLPDPAATVEIVELLPEVEPAVRVVLMDALAARFAVETADSLAVYLQDSDPAVRLAAIHTLEILGDESIVSDLLDRLKLPGLERAEQDAVERTLAEVSARLGAEVVPMLTEVLPDLPRPRRLVVFQAMKQVGGEAALEAVRRERGSDDSTWNAEMLRVLAEWPDAEALPDLLREVRSAENLTEYAVAFRGYVRLVRQSELSDAAKADALRQAMRAARRPEEKLLVLAGFGDQHNLEALKRCEENLYDPAIDEAACTAIVRMVDGALAESAPIDVLLALEQVLRIASDPQIRQAAQAILDEAGIARIKHTGPIDDPSQTRLVFLAGPVDHAGPGAHEHGKDLLLLKRCLQNSSDLEGIVCDLYFGSCPPAEELAGAAVLVVHSSADRMRGESHALFPFSNDANYTPAVKAELADLDDLMRDGMGLAVLHYAVWTDHPIARDYMRQWVGGYHESGQSIVRFAEIPVQLARPDHPVVSGVRPWLLREEYYYQQHLASEQDGLIPLLRVEVPGVEKLEQRIVGWGFKRPSGGRGFAFTGCHTHTHLWHDDYRRFVIQGILWAAGIPIPANGISTTVPPDWQ